MTQSSPDPRSRVEELFSKYKNLMFTVANSVLGNPFDAEDAVFEAFARIIKNIAKIPAEPTKERAFAVIVVKNIAIDMLRKKSRTEVSLPEDFDPAAGNFADEILEKLDESVLRDALARLPDAHYEVLLLKFYYGFGVGEIGSALGLGREAVKSRIRRAKANLRKILEEMGYEQSF